MDHRSAFSYSFPSHSASLSLLWVPRRVYVMLFTQLLLLLLALAAGAGTWQDPPSRSHCWGSLSFLARRHTEVFFFCTRPAPVGGLCRHQEMLKMHSGIEIGECVRQGVMRVGLCVCVCVKAVVPAVGCGVLYLCNCARGCEIRLCFSGKDNKIRACFM